MATWLDDATRQSWGTDGGTFTGGPAKGVLHTTETSDWPGYSNGQTCPHLTVKVERAGILTIRQHVPLNMAARALQNLSGGVQTNRDSAIQIELVGTCNPEWQQKIGYYYWPKADPKTLASLAFLMRRLEVATGIKREAVGPWLSYPHSYGSSGGQRLTLSQWDNYSGWVGHQHVPENDHGDPGNLDIATLLGVVTAPAVTPPLPPASAIPPLVVKPTVRAPAFPLPRGHVFGPKTGPATQHSGYYGSNDRNALRTWQSQMRIRGWSIAVDGLFGPATAGVVRAFQSEKRLGVDGLIGPQTWAAAWLAPR